MGVVLRAAVVLAMTPAGNHDCSISGKHIAHGVVSVKIGVCVIGYFVWLVLL